MLPSSESPTYQHTSIELCMILCLTVSVHPLCLLKNYIHFDKVSETTEYQDIEILKFNFKFNIKHLFALHVIVAS